jgi:hypothetical protein
MYLVTSLKRQIEKFEADEKKMSQIFKQEVSFEYAEEFKTLKNTDND